MLRLLVLILVLANGVYFAWSQGAFAAYGWVPAQPSEPQRLAQQIKPETVHVITPAEWSRLEAQMQADLAPKECLQAGPFDDAQADALRQILEVQLAPGSWELQASILAPRWIIYMGKFRNPQALVKKRAELVAMKLTPMGLSNPELEPGISLGSFDTQGEADTELMRLTQRGIRTARVLLQQGAGQQNLLKIPAVTEGTKKQLNGILTTALAGKPLKPCNEGAIKVQQSAP
jgi:hypothetical protein